MSGSQYFDGLLYHCTALHQIAGYPPDCIYSTTLYILLTAPTLLLLPLLLEQLPRVTGYGGNGSTIGA